MRFPPILLRIIGVALTALMLQACSTVRLAYNQAPELSYWWLNSYFDFNEAQTLRVRAGLAQLQQWHRRSELPAYAETLQKLQRLAPGSVAPQQVCELTAEAKSRLVAVGNRLVPTAIALAPGLGAEQIAHLERQLAKRNQKWRDEWLDGPPDERQARRLKRAVKRAEMVYGPLEEPQLAVLRAGMAASSFDPQISYRETLRRQQDALQTLRQLQGGEPTELQIQAAMRALLDRSLDSPDPAFRRYLDTLTREACQAIAALHNSTTAAQRARAVETFKGYEMDLKGLMTASQ